jgi:RNA polymerase sigma-70 factor (ECF subfamily)
MCADVPPGSASDDELLTAARQGDAAALEALLVRYQPHLYRFGLRMCGNAEDAGDIAQESLISMARSLRDFRGDSSVSSWLYTIARRFCIKKRRRSKFAPEREESLDAAGTDAARRLADPAPSPEQTAANRELEIALARAIHALDPPQREVLVLRDVEGLSAPEVGKVLGISVDAVKSRLHRARVAVRQQLAPVLDSPSAQTPRGAACPDVLTLFSQHLEGEIDPSVCAAMEAHLAECGQCRGA